jgi:hypothetical protein
MANASIAGFGCRQTMTVGNTPATGGQSEFLVQGGAAPGATVANYMWKIVRSANIENQKDFTVAGADVVISYNPQANQYQA